MVAEKDNSDIDDLLDGLTDDVPKVKKSEKKLEQKVEEKPVEAKKNAKLHKELPPVIVGQIELSKVKFNSNNRPATEEAVNELACSIEASKFILPIVINKKNEVLEGERRCRACLQLGYKTIPCIKSDGEFDEISILSNYIRTNLSEDELKLIFDRMHKVDGLTQQEIANRVGISQGRVSQVMKKKTATKKRGRKKGKKVGRVKLPENVRLKILDNRIELTFILDDEMLKDVDKSVVKLCKEIKDLPKLVAEGRK